MDPRAEPEDDIYRAGRAASLSPLAGRAGVRGSHNPNGILAARCTRFPSAGNDASCEHAPPTPTSSRRRSCAKRASGTRPGPRSLGGGGAVQARATTSHRLCHGRACQYSDWFRVSRPSTHQRTPKQAERWILGPSPRMTSIARAARTPLLGGDEPRRGTIFSAYGFAVRQLPRPPARAIYPPCPAPLVTHRKRVSPTRPRARAPRAAGPASHPRRP
jgi:hypothetical protein